MATELFNNSIQTWISALSGAAAVSLVGILPLFIVPNEQSKSNFIQEKTRAYFFDLGDKPYLEILLSVAVGSQLADVFLHLLPEAFAHPHASSISIGIWTLIGLFLFFILEQIFPEDQNEQKIKVRRIFQSIQLNFFSSSFF